MACRWPVQAEQADLQIVAINHDLKVDKPVSYENKHLKIQGNVFLEKGGELTLTNCIVELMCRYTREFRYAWSSGILRTDNVTIGGTIRDGNVEFTCFWLMEGEWHAVDTTVQYSYGIMFSPKTIGKLRGKRFMKGPHPDGVIMNGQGDVVLEDSSFNIALNYSIRDGGTLRFNLPVGENPMTRVFGDGNGEWHILRGKLSAQGKGSHNRSRRYDDGQEPRACRSLSGLSSSRGALFLSNVNTNTKLHEVGESYGVKKHKSDSPHWSYNGH